MARIRSIHPGLWTDDAFVSLSDAAALLYIGLLGEADDNGVFELKPLKLKMRLRPATSETAADIDALLAQIIAANMVMVFVQEGRRLGAVRNFVKWQRPKKPKGTPISSELVRNYVGFNGDGGRPNAGTGRPSTDPGSEGDGAGGETGSEQEPQREEGGGRMDEEGGTAAQQREHAREEAVPVPTVEPPENQLFAECLEAVGKHSPTLAKADFSPILECVDKGHKPGHVIATIRARARATAEQIKSWRYFVDAIEESGKANEAIKPAEVAVVRPMVWLVETDWQWPQASAWWAERYEGKPPPTKGGQGGMGWHFPADVVASLKRPDPGSDLEIPDILRRVG